MTSVGVGSLFGTYDNTTAPTITATVGGSSTARKIQAIKVDWKTEAVINDLNDGNGTPQGFNKVRSVRTVSVECVVRAPVATGALAATKTAIRPPDELTVVTLANFIASADAFLNGDYVYKTGATVSLSDEGEASLKFEMMQYFNGAGTIIAASGLVTAVA